MRQGILPENVYLRSVDKKIKEYNNKRKGAAVGKDCAFLCAESYELYGKDADWNRLISMYMAHVYQKAIAVAGKPACMQAHIVINENTEEESLRTLVRAIIDAAECLCLGLDDMHIRVQDGDSNPQLVFVITGSHINVAVSKKSDMKDLVYIGRTASAGTAYLADCYKQKLLSRYSADYVRRMINAYSPIDIEIYNKISEQVRSGIISLFPVGEGGLFAALWDIGAEHGCGLKTNIKSVSIYQETIELCDFFDVNPYMLMSYGDCILLCNDGEALSKEYTDAGIEASYIGFLTTDNGRVIINNDEERFLTAPQQDELYKIASDI